MNNTDVIEVVIEEGQAIGSRAAVSVPAVTSGLTVDIPLVVARRACMVAELGGLATVTIQVGLEKLAKMAGHLRTIVGALQADGAAAKVAVPVISELWNDAIPKVPVTGEAAVSEGDLSPGGAAVVSCVCEVVVSKGDLSPEETDMVTGSDEVYFQVPDLDELAREVDELTGGASSEVGVPSCSDVTGEQKIGMSVTVGDQTVRRVSMKRTHPGDGHVAREKKRIPGERDCSLCPSGFFCRTPVRRHAVKYNLPWFVIPETACWTCKVQYGSSKQLHQHRVEEKKREEQEGAEYVDMHQVFGASHMVHWCELGLGLLQQLADLVSGGNLGDLLAWCDTNVSMTDHFIHALDSELLCYFALFVGDQPRGERLASLLPWRGLYDILQALVGVVPSEGFQTLDGILRVAAPDERILKDGDVLPKKQGMVDGHSHLDRWAASVGRDARSLLEGVDYDTVTSYCSQKSWRDSRKQCWWPSSKGTLKQAFGLHPVEAASGLTRQTSG